MTGETFGGGQPHGSRGLFVETAPFSPVEAIARSWLFVSSGPPTLSKRISVKTVKTDNNSNSEGSIVVRNKNRKIEKAVKVSEQDRKCYK